MITRDDNGYGTEFHLGFLIKSEASDFWDGVDATFEWRGETQAAALETSSLMLVGETNLAVDELPDFNDSASFFSTFLKQNHNFWSLDQEMTGIECTSNPTYMPEYCTCVLEELRTENTPSWQPTCPAEISYRDTCVPEWCKFTASFMRPFETEFKFEKESVIHIESAKYVKHEAFAYYVGYREWPRNEETNHLPKTPALQPDHFGSNTFELMLQAT